MFAQFVGSRLFRDDDAFGGQTAEAGGQGAQSRRKWDGAEKIVVRWQVCGTHGVTPTLRHSNPPTLITTRHLGCPFCLSFLWIISGAMAHF